ncbi:MAG: DUF438 domain-containing protein, partial [Deltaproteobacteria bacterium]|nr:DUF438 domain-containing protein [Deltaproteobacteria bacterium]
PRWPAPLTNDHATTEKVFAALEQAFASPAGPPAAVIAKMLDYFAVYVDQCHNMKEEKHLFPTIERLGIPRHGGPLGVMLAEHEQARTLLARWKPLAQAYVAGDRASLLPLRDVFEEYSTLLKQHFWKENDILYPMALRVVAEADARKVVAGIEQVEAGLGPDTRARYYAVADEIVKAGALDDLSYGLGREVLAAMLNALPVEVSFVDADDTVRYFSHENRPKIFGRTRGAIGTKVENCHPPKSLHLVRQILADFKAGTRDVAEFWIDLGPRKVHIRYWPVRDPSGRYLGCMETVQDVTAIQKLGGQKRLLDPA